MREAIPSLTDEQIDALFVQQEQMRVLTTEQAAVEIAVETCSCGKHLATERGPDAEPLCGFCQRRLAREYVRAAKHNRRLARRSQFTMAIPKGRS